MNKLAFKINEELLEYQTQRLQHLITEVIQCCEDRKLYQARKFGLPYAEVKCLLLFPVIASDLEREYSRNKVMETLNPRKHTSQGSDWEASFPVRLRPNLLLF